MGISQIVHYYRLNSTINSVLGPEMGVLNIMLRGFPNMEVFNRKVPLHIERLCIERFHCIERLCIGGSTV